MSEPDRKASPAGSRPAARGPYARWARDLALGVRLACAGGRAGWGRIAMTAAGVGLGVAMLLVAASIPTMLRARHERTSARDYATMGGEPARSDRSLLIGTADTEFHGRSIRGRMLRPEGPGAPLPPGVRAIPRPGEMVVSPALAGLLSSREGALLRPRLDYRVVGTIGPRGLDGPREYAFYAGSDRLTKHSGLVARVTSFGARSPNPGLGPVLLLLVVIAFVVLLLPIAVFVGTAMRFGGESRDRRLAALRLIGADRHMARRFAAGEAMVAAVFGLLAGALMFLGVRMFVPHVTLLRGVGFFTSDVRPALVPAALIVLAVPVSAVFVALFSLRKVVIEPLGVVRRAAGARRRLWWRAAVPLAGLALLYPLFGGLRRTGGAFNEYQIAGGVTILLIGVAALLPWVVEAAVGRLGGGRPSWQLAVRRLQLDGGASVRAVSGVVVAVAGTIALQTMFSGVRGDYVEQTGQDPSRAQVVVVFRDTVDGTRTAEVAARLGAAPGVRAVIGRAATGMVPEGARDETAETLLTVAGCPALREMIRIDHCADGDVFVAGSPDPGAPRPGTTVRIDPEDDAGAPPGPTWRFPASARPAGPRTDPLGDTRTGVFATFSAVDRRVLRRTRVTALVRVDRSRRDAVEHLRNAVAAIDPMADVTVLSRTRYDDQFATVRRGLFIGAVAALLVIGASLLVTALEQMRERRRLLAMLVAFGTPRSVLNRSVLWQTAVPMLLGLLLAIPAGTGIGALLLKASEEPVSVNWTAVAGICGAAAGVVLLVTTLGISALRRLMDPDGLRTE